MSEIEFWQIAAGLMATVFFWFAKQGFNQLIKKLDDLLIATRENNSDIMLLKDKVETHGVRLNDHSKSIREIERKVK